MAATNAHSATHKSDENSKKIGKNILPNSNSIARKKRAALGDIRPDALSNDRKDEPSAKARGKKSPSGDATVGAPAKAQSRKRVRTADKENAGPEGRAIAKRSKVGRAPSVKVTAEKVPATTPPDAHTGPAVTSTYAVDLAPAPAQATSTVADPPTPARVIPGTSDQGPPAVAVNDDDENNEAEEDGDRDDVFDHTLIMLNEVCQIKATRELGCDPHGVLEGDLEYDANGEEWDTEALALAI